MWGSPRRRRTYFVVCLTVAQALIGPTPASAHTVSCSGSSVSHGDHGDPDGDPRADTINGGSADNAFAGLELGDTITGGNGNDDICGNDGPDELYGEGDNDDLNGGTGNDFISGGAGGGDDVHGREGGDTVNGNEGNDTLGGDQGGDDIAGNTGSDELYDGDGSDTMTGGAANDAFATCASDGEPDTITDFSSSEDLGPYVAQPGSIAYAEWCDGA